MYTKKSWLVSATILTNTVKWEQKMMPIICIKEGCNMAWYLKPETLKSDQSLICSEGEFQPHWKIDRKCILNTISSVTMFQTVLGSLKFSSQSRNRLCLLYLQQWSWLPRSPSHIYSMKSNVTTSSNFVSLHVMTFVPTFFSGNGLSPPSKMHW